MGKAPKSLKVGNRRYVRSYRAEHIRSRELRLAPGEWPRLSDAMGVHPVQVKTMEKRCRDLGVPTHYTKDGRAQVDNPSHQRKLIKALELVDRAAWC